MQVRLHRGAHVPGVDEWYPSLETHGDYFEALVYAMVLLERCAEVDDVRVVPATAHEHTGGDAPTEPAV